MAKKREHEIKINLNEAVQEGIQSIVEEHPRFEKFGSHLAKYLDNKALNSEVNELAKRARQKKLGAQETQEYIQSELADYISSGEAFNEKGKRLIVGGGALEERTKGLGGLLKHIFIKPKFDGSKYLDKTIGAANDMYELFQSGDYARRMPELVESVNTLYDSGFLDAAIETLKTHDLIDSKKYRFLKQEVYSRAKEAEKGMIEGVERYTSPQKIAASILGILGMLVISVSSQITGAVIGVQKFNYVTETIGVVMLLVSTVLMFVKKKTKLDRKKD